MKSFKNIDEYIRAFPAKIQKELRTIRKSIRKLAPKATEKIAYGVPTFVLHKNLVHFAAFKKHISLFPTSSPIEAFKKELAAYETSRGTIRFPLDKPLPHALIRRIVRFRVKQVTQAAKSKARKTKLRLS